MKHSELLKIFDKKTENTQKALEQKDKPKKIEKFSSKRMDFLKQINDNIQNNKEANNKNQNDNKKIGGFNKRNKDFINMINQNISKKEDKPKDAIKNSINIKAGSNSNHERIDIIQENKDIKKNEEKAIKIETKSIQERIKEMNENQKAKEPIQKLSYIESNSNSIQERIKKLQESTNNENNENKKVIFGSMSIQERIKKMQEEQQPKNNNENNNYNDFKSFSLKDRIKELNKKQEEKEIGSISDEPKSKILKGSIIISDENSEMIIYKYPNIPFSKTENNNCKILLFLGNAQRAFINTFINIYSDISFNDNLRYIIESNESNEKIKNNFLVYDIRSKTKSKNYNLKIICIPYMIEKNDNFNNSLIDILKNKLPRNKINLVCVTLDENNIYLEDSEIIFYKLIINLFNLRDKVLFLFSSNQFNNNEYKNKIIDDLMKIEKNDYLYENNLSFNQEFIYMNNKIIFENNENSEKEWELLIDSMKKIQNKISLSKGEEIIKDKFSFLNKIFSIEKEEDNKTIQREFSAIKRTEKIIYLNYLINTKKTYKKDISILILSFYNILNKDNQKEYYINNSEIKLISDENANKDINILSKLSFNNLKMITFQNCSLYDNDINLLKALFTSNLQYLDLSKNKISDLEVFSKEEIYNNLEFLNLSNNYIDNIIPLFHSKFNNLKNLNLSYNNIFDIYCLGFDNIYFDKLQKLDLSNNHIKKLNKMNIPSLTNLNLINNEIDSGINEFLESICEFSHKLEILNENNNEIIFNYSNNLNIKFKYLIKDKDLINILGKISFNGIYDLKINGFDNNNLDFLCNESLKEIKILDLAENKITDISVFNKIHFFNINKIYINSNNIEKGFNSLNSFNSIEIKCVKIDYIENKYICNIEFYNPTLNLNFEDINFLYDNLFLRTEKVDISDSSFNNDSKFFSYEVFKNYTLPMFKNIKSKKIKINYQGNKYICEITFKSPELKTTFKFDELNFIKNDDLLIETEEIEISNILIDNNLNFESSKAFQNIKLLSLYNNTIECTEIFSQLFHKNIKIISRHNMCNKNLIDFLIEDYFEMSNIFVENNLIKINYIKPFIFNIFIDKNKLDNIKTFKNCEKIDIQNLGLNDNDINFLKNETLSDLKTIILEGNQITNLNFLDKLVSKNLNHISLKNNPINNCVEYIDNNLKSLKIKNIEIKLKKDHVDSHLISFNYDGNYSLYFDYLINKDKNLEILQQINLKNITELNLSKIELKKIDFLVNESLINLKEINLFKNIIEDISILTEENIYFKELKFLNLKDNPIRKGLEVLNKNFFTKCIYIEVNITKLEQEYKISSEFKEPNYDLDFFITNVDEIKSIFDNKKIFINYCPCFDDFTENEKLEKQEIYRILKLILNKDNNWIYTLDINIKENKNIINYIFNLLLNKGINSSSILSRLSIIDTYFNIEKIKLYFPDYDLNNNDNSNIALSNLNTIDLSHVSLIDISPLCGDVPFINLETLKICNNKNIKNLYELKNSKFVNLKELYLVNDGICDLNEIKMGEYHFYLLRTLDLSKNFIKNLHPISIPFRNLKFLNLENNMISDEKELNYVINIGCRINIKGNDVSGVSLGIFKL